MITVDAIKALKRLWEQGIDVLMLSRSESEMLKFSPGHPRDGVLYIGHPAESITYYTAAQFHRLTFEHKFCEACELLRYLGANKIKVAYVSGWSRKFGAKAFFPAGMAAGLVGADVGLDERVESQILFEGRYAGDAPPCLPDSLVWYPHEPTWQDIAQGRLEHGLQNFSLYVRYEDDFGVHAGFKLAAMKAGLDLGGRFEDHLATVWQIFGDFGKCE